MTKGEFKENIWDSQLKYLIREAQNNDNFGFSAASLGRIRDLADSWQAKWTTIFRLILRRIKNGQGFDDTGNENGKYMTLPIDDKKSMVIFFKPQEEKRYLIYDFKIIKK